MLAPSTTAAAGAAAVVVVDDAGAADAVDAKSLSRSTRALQSAFAVAGATFVGLPDAAPSLTREESPPPLTSFPPLDAADTDEQGDLSVSDATEKDESWDGG